VASRALLIGIAIVVSAETAPLYDPGGADGKRKSFRSANNL